MCKSAPGKPRWVVASLMLCTFGEPNIDAMSTGLEVHLPRPPTQHAFHLPRRQGRQVTTQDPPGRCHGRCISQGPKAETPQSLWHLLALTKLAFGGRHQTTRPRMGRSHPARSTNRRRGGGNDVGESNWDGGPISWFRAGNAVESSSTMPAR
jgi:hypothetical protein